MSKSAQKPRKPGTATSAFGSPGRVNHDASAYYTGRMAADLPGETGAAAAEAPLPEDCRNTIFCGSSAQMTALPAGCVHLMVTSPPYNVGKDYDENLTLPEYLARLGQVWAEVWRVLAPGGRACINVANLGRKPYIPLHLYITQQMQDLGFLMRCEIIWNKAASSSPSTAWGSWRSAKNPTLRDVHEYILVFSKGSFSRAAADRPSTLERDEFLELTKSIWTFPAAQARSIGHPAPFPLELPHRLIQLYTFAGDVVLDPFMGSGQTAIAALQAGRSYVGYEQNPDYAALAERRIADFRSHQEEQTP